MHQALLHVPSVPQVCRGRRLLHLLVIPALIVPGLATVPASVLAATTPAASTAAAPITAPAVHEVTLVTGETVVITASGGKSTYSITGGDSRPDALTKFQGPNGDEYVIPAEASPYLGRQLDLSLFDVTALLRDGLDGTARIPVDLVFGAGSTPTAPPGVTLTSTGATTATGYLTPSSGAQFAAGLRAAIGADVGAGRQPGTSALFGGLSSMSLAEPASPAGPAAAPRFPLSILEFDVTDLTGAPVGFSDAFLINTDSVHRTFDPDVPVAGGLGRVAVPAGDYFALLSFADFNAQGNVTDTRTVTLGNFKVATTGTTHVSVSESNASHLFTVKTPMRSTEDSAIYNWVRQDAKGVDVALTSFILGKLPAYFNSQPPPTVGKLRFTAQWGGRGPAKATPRYRYDVAYGSFGIAADQHHIVGPGDVATVHQAIYNDPADTSHFRSLLNGAVDSFYSVGSAVSGGNAPLGETIDYLGASDGGQWQQSYFSPEFLELDSDIRTFAAGGQYRVEWDHGPLAPNVGNHVGPSVDYTCFACASAKGVSLEFNPVGDSEPTHVGIPFQGFTSLNYELSVNGTVVANSPGAIGAETGPPPAGATTYREVFDTSFAGIAGFSQSTVTHTDLSFVYDAQADPGPVLPSGTFCDDQGVITPPCHILPVLNLSYHLATDTHNTASPGPQVLVLTVDHLSYDGLGSHSPIKSASVSVSFDGGQTWQPALVRGALGEYVAVWNDPASAAGTSPELEVTATDAAGGSITQTVQNAYTVSSATP